jgi:hypothetical protein
MERRILVNYRVDPDTLASILPAPFRPALVDGHGVAGICLIRLGHIRPAGLPARVGLTTENAAHRVAVCWDSADGPVTGVYIPRRDTSSRAATLAGGRLFPGWQHFARFEVEEGAGCFRVHVESRDGAVRILVAAHLAVTVMAGSVFPNLDIASRFFQCAPVGYAATPSEGVFDGVELAADGWAMRPLHIDEASSSFFGEPDRFPPSTTIVDSAFVMGGLDTTWHAQPKLVEATIPGRRVAA